MMTTWPAPAKLNLFLYITGRRPDGYHNLQTLFQFLDYGDSLHITPCSHGEIRLLTPVPGVAHEDNLIVRAARLPMGGGLGGGSSNAATVLVALNHLWNTGLDSETLCALGLKLGADVPVFVRGHAAFAEGVGEALRPASPPEKWYLVAHPGVAVSTPQVFGDPELTRNSPVRSFDALLQAPFGNDCESVVRKRFREAI